MILSPFDKLDKLDVILCPFDKLDFFMKFKKKKEERKKMMSLSLNQWAVCKLTICCSVKWCKIIGFTISF